MKRYCAFTFMLLLVLTGCKPEKPEITRYRLGEQGLAVESSAQEEKLGNSVVAQIDGYAVTAAQIARALRMLPPYQRFYYSSPEKIRIFIQNYAVLHLLARQAADDGLDASEYVRYVLETELAGAYRKKVLVRSVKASDIGKNEVARYMASNRAGLMQRLKEAGIDQSDADLETAARALLMEEKRKKVWSEHLSVLRSRYGLKGERTHD